ncbi:MAG: 30S ribosomal protein S20 [Bacteroidales bacterium]|nr:30S ribosomal protein S20 [Bacteroidales bacterium]
MAHHKSAKKRIRQNIQRRAYNRYYAKTMKNAIKKFKLLSNPEEIKQKISSLISLIDKNKKRGIIHPNKAARLKSVVMKKAFAHQSST